MGYAMFSSRELMLVSQINDLQYKLTELTMRQQDLSLISTAYTQQTQAYFNFTTQQFDQTAFNQYINSLPSGANISSLQDPNGTLSVISGIEKQIHMESKRYQTLLQAKQSELEAIEKGKEQGIKNATPKYA